MILWFFVVLFLFTEVHHAASTSLCSISGASVGRPERDEHLLKNQACSQQEWASFLAPQEVTTAKNLQKQATRHPLGMQEVTLSFKCTSAPLTPGPRSESEAGHHLF